MRNISLVAGILLFIVFFLVGWFTYNSFVDWWLIREGARYTTHALNTLSIKSVLFSLALAVIPLSTVLIWRLGPVLTIKRKLLVPVIIILITVLSCFAERQLEKQYIRKNSQPGYDAYIVLGKYNGIEMYMLAGVCVGSCLALFVLRQKKTTHDELSF